MKVLEAWAEGFGKFRNRRFHFSEDLNVVYGYNEAGKTTLHAFLCAMLYGFPKKRRQEDPGKWYQPWDGEGGYGGELRFSYLGRQYLLHRDFASDEGAFEGDDGEEGAAFWIAGEDGRRLPDPQGLLSEALGGITETAFRNSVSIGQLKAATDREMARELRNYIGNMQTSHDSKLNADKALALLSSRLADLEGRRLPGAAKEYAALAGEERKLEQEIADPKYENLMPGLSRQREQALAALSKGRERRDTLLQDLERDRERLRQAGFLDDAAVDRQAAEVEAAFRQREGLLEKEKKGIGGKRVFLLFLPGVVLLLLACLGIAEGGSGAAFSASGVGAVGGFAAGLGLPRWLVCVMFFLLSLFFFCAGIVSVLEGRRIRAELRSTEQSIQRMAAPVLRGGGIESDTLDSYRTFTEGLKEGCGRIRENGRELENLSQELAELSRQEETCQTELSRQETLQEELEGKLRHLANVQNRAALLQGTLSENEKLEREAEAVRLAMETMEGLRESMKRSFGTYLNRDLGEVLSRLTGGAYDSIWLDDSLKIYLNTGDRMLPMERTSTGTIDQVYLALRLSCARFLQEGSRELLPLLLDDSFAMYDEQRLRDAIQYLREAYQGQVILFTCHTRERRILDQEEASYRHIAL